MLARFDWRAVLVFGGVASAVILLAVWWRLSDAAGIDMLIGIVIYLSGTRYFPTDDLSTCVSEAKVRLQRGDLRKR